MTGSGSLGGILQSANILVDYLVVLAWIISNARMANCRRSCFENPHDVWNLTSSRQLVNQTGLWTIVFVMFDNMNKALSHMNFGTIMLMGLNLI